VSEVNVLFGLLGTVVWLFGDQVMSKQFELFTGVQGLEGWKAECTGLGRMEG
jgi:hypothetical protein